jgi:hypothetical protein
MGTAAPSLQGTLDEFSLDTVLTLLASSAQTGVLQFDGPRPGALWFAGGSVYRAAPAGEGDDPHERIVDTLFELMVTGESFEFRQGEYDSPADAIDVDADAFPVADLVAAAEARVEHWREIAATLPSTAAVVRLAPQLPNRRSKVTITAEDWEVLALLDGRAAIGDVMRACGRSAFEVMATVHRLVDTGLAELVDEAPRSVH